jgi:hypothetical protein
MSSTLQPSHNIESARHATSGRLIAADKVEGTAVYNPQGDQLGTIETFMLDKANGKAAYAVLSFGGFLGVGTRLYPLPWSTLKYDASQGGYVVNLDKRVLENAPSYAEGDTVSWEDRAWGERVHDYYKAPPYWM